MNATFAHAEPMGDAAGRASRAPRVWGFEQMFGRSQFGLGETWVERMTRAVLELLPHAGTDGIVLFSRPIEGRNITRHCSNQVVLDEVTRWRLYVQPHLPKAYAVPCVNRPRHCELPCTARYDWRLPATEDGARYPFCSPPGPAAAETRPRASAA